MHGPETNQSSAQDHYPNSHQQILIPQSINSQCVPDTHAISLTCALDTAPSFICTADITSNNISAGNTHSTTRTQLTVRTSQVEPTEKQHQKQTSRKQKEAPQARTLSNNSVEDVRKQQAPEPKKFQQ